jgi:hypothetical protein
VGIKPSQMRDGQAYARLDLVSDKKGENKLGRLAINPNDRLSDTATPSPPRWCLLALLCACSAGGPTTGRCHPSFPSPVPGPSQSPFRNASLRE